jgi:hypothetical protein
MAGMYQSQLISANMVAYLPMPQAPYQSHLCISAHGRVSAASGYLPPIPLVRRRVRHG